MISPPNVYSIHSLLNPNQYQRLSSSSSRSNSAELNDQKHLTNEQIEFLEKFFKENPWADQAQLDAIVKATGLNEPMIKVRRLREERKTFSSRFSADLFGTTANEMESNLCEPFESLLLLPFVRSRQFGFDEERIRFDAKFDFLSSLS